MIRNRLVSLNPEVLREVVSIDTVHIRSIVITRSFSIVLLSGPVEFYCVWLPCHVQTFCNDSSSIKLNITSSITSLLGVSQWLSSILRLFVESFCLMLLCLNFCGFVIFKIFYIPSYHAPYTASFVRKKYYLHFYKPFKRPRHHDQSSPLQGIAYRNCKLFALVAWKLEAHVMFGTRKRRLSDEKQQTKQKSSTLDRQRPESDQGGGVRFDDFLAVGWAAYLPIFGWKTMENQRVPRTF